MVSYGLIIQVSLYPNLHEIHTLTYRILYSLKRQISQRKILRKEVGFGSMTVGKLLGDPKLVITVVCIWGIRRFTIQ